MPTQKKKVKKAKEDSDTKPPAASIKQEPEELKPLGAYVDDRLELIRQMFSCVKPKEIKHLLPDFLEGKSNDVIKERCLDELLGISTKRLHSIINNTKCPTDTESSSEEEDEEGSDVEKIEEHISLDEISSDSDVDSKRTAKRNKKGDGSKQSDERNGEPKSEKEMTVLELLELQARARAIRSQLALEPVTKIEIDSEHEADDDRHGDVDTDDDTKPPARSSKAASEAAKNGTQFKNENNSDKQTKRVRLKRNFRIRKVGDEDDEDQEELSSNNGREKSTEQAMEVVEDSQEKAPERSPKAEVEVEKEKAAEGVTQAETENSADERTGIVEKEGEIDSVEKEGENIDSIVVLAVADAKESDATKKDDGAVESTPRQGEEADRESSPEVIPVEASPETLCISSDSEEERLAKERASIFVPNIEELDQQLAKKQPTPEVEKPAEDTEPEEGEISEEEEQPPEPTVMPEEEKQDEEKETTGSVEDAAPKEAAEAVPAEDTEQEDATEQEKTQTKDDGAQDVTQKDNSVVLSSGSSDESNSGSSSSSSSSSESDAEEEDAKVDAPPKLDHSAQDDADIVEIHDSGDETLLLGDKPPEEEEKSWNSRWLKSNRVAKVMAASRLGNKVREKLKKKKQIQQAAEQQQQEKVAEGPDAAEAASKAGNTSVAAVVATAAELPTNIELGSVEHYRELVAQQESKQD